jgi:hypothetical protein
LIFGKLFGVYNESAGEGEEGNACTGGVKLQGGF